MAQNAKTTADVRGASRASPRGAILAPSPRCPRRGAHVPGARDGAETRGYASCARASSGVFARTEQHVGQLFDGTPFPARRVSGITRFEKARPGDWVFRERPTVAGAGSE